jgi:DNA-binding transcriptional LysR family regulator
MGANRRQPIDSRKLKILDIPITRSNQKKEAGMGSINRLESTSQLLNRLRMRQLALILAIDERHTLRGAAAQLGLTQPAATKMLHELEDALGMPLFERVGRGLRLNAGGERVTGYFRAIRGSMEALNRELGELRLGSAGRLAVGSIMAASPGRLTDALLGLKQQFPLLSIEVAVDTSDLLLGQLREGVLEVVVGRPAGEPGGPYAFRAIDGEGLSIVVANTHPLARKRKVAFGALVEYPWVLQPPGSPMRDVMEHEFLDHQCPLPRGLIETGSILTTINLVRSSTLVGVIPETVARQNAAHGMLHVLPYRLRRALQAYGSLVRTDRPLSPPAQSLLALLHR